MQRKIKQILIIKQQSKPLLSLYLRQRLVLSQISLGPELECTFQRAQWLCTQSQRLIRLNANHQHFNVEHHCQRKQWNISQAVHPWLNASYPLAVSTEAKKKSRSTNINSDERLPGPGQSIRSPESTPDGSNRWCFCSNGAFGT